MTTWKEEILDEMKRVGESFEDFETTTLTAEDFNLEFDNGYGSPEGKAFTLWTKNRVYFPVCYDGAECVSSVPRNPSGGATNHVGGW